MGAPSPRSPETATPLLLSPPLGSEPPAQPPTPHQGLSSGFLAGLTWVEAASEPVGAATTQLDGRRLFPAEELALKSLTQ